MGKGRVLFGMLLLALVPKSEPRYRIGPEEMSMTWLPLLIYDLATSTDAGHVSALMFTGRNHPLIQRQSFLAGSIKINDFVNLLYSKEAIEREDSII